MRFEAIIMESRHRSVILAIPAVGAVLAVAFVTTRDKPKIVQTAVAIPVSSAKAKPDQPSIAKQTETRPVEQTAISPDAELVPQGIHTPPFEYMGLRLGMSGDAVLKARDAIDAADGESRWSLSVYQNEDGRLYGVQQNLGGASIESYVLAFTRKYGTPRVERRTYRNGFGNEFHGNAWVWGSHDGESLQVMEICAGTHDAMESMPDIGCLVLHSFAYAPKQAPPEI
jgi:hypothetical protein